MLTLHSSVFDNGSLIPRTYTCEGDNISPPLAIAGVPAGARSLALVMDDPDVPKALRPEGVFDHWVVFNIPPTTADIPEGGPVPGVEGVHTRGKAGYTGPCPPLEYEPSEHRYFFRLYALDTVLDMGAGATKAQLLQAIGGHIVEEAELMGRYRKQGH